MKRLILLVMLCNLGTVYSWAQKTFNGKVTDTSGLSVPGVTVVEKTNKKNGAITDIDGKWTLKVPSGNSILVFTAIGMKKVEIAAKYATNIKMKNDAATLDEVVVTGIGMSRKKKTLGYASQEIKSEELVKTRQTDLNNALVGKVSGVRFLGASGATFDTGTITLRGTASIGRTTGNSPIYVVDGVITSPQLINMDDVASVNVLKGPAATAIYGSAGGNGAIIVTTKSMKGEGQQINITHTLAVEKADLIANYQTEYGGGLYGANGKFRVFKFDPKKHPKELKMLDGANYYDYNSDVSWGIKFNPKIKYAPWYAWDPKHPKFGQLIPWSSAPSDDILNLYRTGILNTTNLSLEKSSKDYMSRVSFTNSHRRGIMPNSDATRRFLSFKTKYKASKKITVSLDYKYTYRKNHNAAKEGYGKARNAHHAFTQWAQRNVFINDLKDYKGPDGKYRSWNIRSITNPMPAYHNNPFAILNEINVTYISSFNVFNGNLSYDITKDLKASVMIKGNIVKNKSEVQAPQDFLNITPLYSTSQSKSIDMQYQGKLSHINRLLDNRIIWDTDLFIESNSNEYNFVKAFTRDGLIFNKLPNVIASKGLSGGSSNKVETASKSIFGTSRVSFDDTYFAELTLRNDWKSTLPANNNSYLYGGGSLSILVHKWLKNANVLNFWKLRSSVAQVGSSLGAYSIYPTYIMGKTQYGRLKNMTFNNKLKNPYIRPTISTSYEVGMEFRMFNSRAWGDLNFYHKDSKDQIIKLDIAPQSKYSSRIINAGLIRNKGIELSLGGNIIQNNNFIWTVNGNIAFNKNTLEKLTDNITKYNMSNFKLASAIYNFSEVGEPIGVLRGTDFARDPEGNVILKKNKSKNAIEQIGKYDVVLNNNESNYLGNIQPKATGGFSTNLEFKGIRLSTSLDFQIGGLVASLTNMYGEGSGLLTSTVGKNSDGVDIRTPIKNGGGMDIEGVINEGTDTKPVYKKIKARINPYVYYKQRKSSVWGPYMYDASYVKMREIALSYTLPKNLMDKWGAQFGLKEVSLSFILQNPWLIYSATPNIDPSETAGYTVEGGKVNTTRSLGFTLNVKF